MQRASKAFSHRLDPKSPVVNGRNRATQSGGGPLTATSHGSGGGERDLALAQVALCSGARAVLKVLDHMIAKASPPKCKEPIERHGRRIKRLQGATSRSAAALTCLGKAHDSNVGTSNLGSGRRLDRDHLNSSADDRTTAKP